jgi:hypothetical protein
MRVRPLAALLIWCGTVAGVGAQTLPSSPIDIGSGRLVLGGDVSATIAPDDPGFFNYSDYEHSVLREFRIGLTASVRASDRVSLLGELRTDNFRRVTPFALYARVRPFPGRRFDLQIGRIPPTFGEFTRRAYGNDNPLIGYPLAYQYLTSLRSDALPASTDELLRMRGRGWLTNFSIGNTTPARGVPLVTAFSWDTGAQVTTGWRAITVTGAITNGSLSNPRVSDDNGGKQVAARIVARPATGLVTGVSYARGQFLGRRVLDVLWSADEGSFVQRAYGSDIEYSRDHWLVRGNAVLSEWDLPIPRERTVPLTLRALAVSVEGRYTILPGVYAAARAEQLSFNRVEGTARTAAWDAPVSRIEVGGGYYLQRNLVAKLSLQRNVRDGGRVPRAHLMAAQLHFWF